MATLVGDPSISVVTMVEWTAMLVMIAGPLTKALETWTLPRNIYIIHVHIWQIMAVRPDPEISWKHAIVLVWDLAFLVMQAGFYTGHIQRTDLDSEHPDQRIEYLKLFSAFLLVMATFIRYITSKTDIASTPVERSTGPPPPGYLSATVTDQTGRSRVVFIPRKNA